MEQLQKVLTRARRDEIVSEAQTREIEEAYCLERADRADANWKRLAVGSFVRVAEGGGLSDREAARLITIMRGQSLA